MTRFLAAIAAALLALPANAAEKKKKPPPPPPEMPLPPLAPLPLPEAPEQKPAQAEKPAERKPDLLPPPLAKPSRTGVQVSGDLDPASAARLAVSLRSIAALAPVALEPAALPDKPCDTDACLAALGADGKVDQVLAARVSGGALRVRAIDVATGKAAGDAQQAAPADAAELRAAAEALACKLLVPAGCTGEAQIDAPDARIEVDGKPAAGRIQLPVGVHSLVVRQGAASAQRALPIVHEKPFALRLQRDAGRLALLTPDEVAQKAVLATEAPSPGPRRRWTRTAGYIAAGAGVVAAGIAIAEGAHSKSLLDSAENGYRANGNVYRPADLSNLTSGNSAARTANVLFAAAGVLVASGLLLTFAF